jgi:hypothetical protein
VVRLSTPFTAWAGVIVKGITGSSSSVTSSLCGGVGTLGGSPGGAASSPSSG